ncbi:MAG: SET domain-containing protein-lysine N-methyltransferase [Planctomycetota bacterium]
MRRPAPIAVQSPLIEVRRVNDCDPAGRGVFARTDISAGSLIERMPVLLIPRKQVFGANPTAKRAARISWYVFDRGKVDGQHMVGLALGYGSLYNHATNPNAEFEHISPDLMHVNARRDITAGEEITLHYKDDPGVEVDLGFEQRDSQVT